MGTDILGDVLPNNGFWFCNNSRAMNLYQLVDTIEHTNEGIFLYHVAGERNDFAKWILDVVGDEVLYYQVIHEKDRYWFIQKVRHRIADLEEQASKSVNKGV